MGSRWEIFVVALKKKKKVHQIVSVLKACFAQRPCSQGGISAVSLSLGTETGLLPVAVMHHARAAVLCICPRAFYVSPRVLVWFTARFFHSKVLLSIVHDTLQTRESILRGGHCDSLPCRTQWRLERLRACRFLNLWGRAGGRSCRLGQPIHVS